MTLPSYERFRKPLLWIARCYFAYMAYALLSPRPWVPPPVEYVFSIVHFCAFVLLAFLVSLVRERWDRAVWLILLLCWGAGTEWLQQYTGRCFQYADMIQNVAGIAFGFAVGDPVRAFWVRCSAAAKTQEASGNSVGKQTDAETNAETKEGTK